MGLSVEHDQVEASEGRRLQLGAQLEELAVHLVAHPWQPAGLARVGIDHRRPHLWFALGLGLGLGLG